MEMVTSFQRATGSTPFSLPHNFILPDDKRPFISQVCQSASIPIIDMNDDGDDDAQIPSAVIRKISEACKEYGFFQIINHGVPHELCQRMMGAVNEFFQLPPEERAQLYSEDRNVPVKVGNYHLKVQGKEKFSDFMEMVTSFQRATGSTPFSLPHNFILPDDKRPFISQVCQSASIPIIDMNDDGDDDAQIPSAVIRKISEACKEYGFFQIINHGVPDELCQRMMGAVNDFFQLPPEERAQLYSEDRNVPVKVGNYHLKVQGKEKVTMWSEYLFHPWHPTEDFTHLLPQNPPHYREVFAEYAKEIGKLMRRLLGLISQGLGLEMDCIERRLGKNPRTRVQLNCYPPCPEPELTLGLPVHTDMGGLTLVQQVEGVTGLQALKDGKWLAVDPVPNAFVINLADQIQVLSNGRYKSVRHRAVTNNKLPRVSIAMFYGPEEDVVIGPIEDLIDEEHPRMYRNYRFEEFLKEFIRQEGTRWMVKEVFELDPKMHLLD